jgi:hypothetical protein
MTIDPALLTASGIDAEALSALALALAAHADTGRTASVTIKLTVKTDKETGATKVKARVEAKLPENDDDARTKKYPSVVVMTVDNDHPGQQRIET